MSSLFERQSEWNPPVPPRTPVASWYTPSQSDGFGDRLLMSDTASASSLELLRFRPQFGLVRSFERALRARVERQKFFRHQAFSAIRAVEYLDGHRGLALVSVHVPGRRVSDLLEGSANKGVHPKLAGWLIRQLVPALADLQAQGGGPHGVLTADRIMLTPECTPVIVEHVLGQALEQLYLPPARLWSEFGLVAPGATGIARFDGRSDVMQLGLIVLGLLLGRRITPSEYPSTLEQLLDECSASVGRRSPSLARPLRTWLERALRMEGLLYKSAAEAQSDLASLPDDIDPQVGGFLPPDEGNENEELFEDPLPSGRYPRQLAPVLTNDDFADEPLDPSPVTAAVPAPPLGQIVEQPPRPVRADQPTVATSAAVSSPLFGSLAPELVEPRDRRAITTPLMAICALLVVVVVAQSIAIIRLLPTGSALSPVERSRTTDVTLPGAVQKETALPVEPQQAPHPVPAAVAAALPSRPAEPATPAIGRPRSGGVRVFSPLPLVAVEGDRILGSSADGPIYAAAGTHEIDFINSAVGLKEHRTITVKPGEIVALRITPPDGRLSINATPWAQVWVDGRALGETPIANVSLALGEHYVTFRHPQLGESRRTVVVRTGEVTRVSASFGE